MCETRLQHKALSEAALAKQQTTRGNSPFLSEEEFATILHAVKTWDTMGAARRRTYVSKLYRLQLGQQVPS